MMCCVVKSSTLLCSAVLYHMLSQLHNQCSFVIQGLAVEYTAVRRITSRGFPAPRARDTRDVEIRVEGLAWLIEHTGLIRNGESTDDLCFGAG